MSRDLGARWLNVEQAVARLAESGVSRTAATIRWWIREGYLPARRHRGRLYVTEGELMDAERDTRLRAAASQGASA